MGLVQFLGLRTYSVELRRDLEVLEKNFNDLVRRTAALFANEPSAHFEQTPNNTTVAANHAHRHANSGSSLAGTGADPLGPFSFRWTGTHTYNPVSAYTPITVNTTAAQGIAPATIWNPLSGLDTVVSSLGHVGVGEPEPTARLSVRATSGLVVSEANITALTPYLWWDASDIDGDETYNSAYADGAAIATCTDKTGNSHHLTEEPGDRPILHKTAGPNGTGILAPRAGLTDFDAWGGTAWGDPSAWTIFVVFENTNSPWSNPYTLFCSAPYGGGGSAARCTLSFPSANFGAPSNAAYVEGHDGTPGTVSRVESRNMDDTSAAWESTWYSHAWRKTAAGVHAAYMQGSLLGSGSHTVTGTTPNTRSGWTNFLWDGNTFSYPQFAEVLMFQYALSDTQMQEVETYLAQKYNSAVSSDTPLQDWKTSDGTIDSLVNSIVYFGLGTASPLAKLHIQDVAPRQFRCDYDTSNYLALGVSPTGLSTFDTVGSAPSFSFLDPTTITSTTTPQFSVLYNATNYVTTSVGSSGAVTMNAAGSNASFQLLDPTTVTTTVSPQFAVGYSSTNYMSVSVSSNATTTFDLTTTGNPYFSFTRPTEILSTSATQFSISRGGGVYLGFNVASDGVAYLQPTSNILAIGGGATATSLRFMEPSGSGTNYSEFKAAAQAGNITYTLPTAIVASGLLNTNGSGTLAWSTVSTLGIVSGTGTTNTLPKWTNGAGGVLGDSLASDDGDTFTILSAASATIGGAQVTVYGSSSLAPGFIDFLAGSALSGNNSGGGFGLNAGIGSGSGGGGGFNLSAGAGGATGNGGSAQFNAGHGGGTSGIGGSVLLVAGSAFGGNSNGGSIRFFPGAKSGSGAPGVVVVRDPSSSFDGSLSFASLSANRTFTFPDASGTIALTSDLSAYQPVDVDLTEIAAVANVRGDLLYTDSGPVWRRLAVGAANTVLFSDGTDVAWGVGFTPTWGGIHTFSAQDIHNAGVSLGTSGALTRAALAAGGGVNLTLTPSWSAGTATAGDIGLLIKPNQVMAVNTAILQVQNSVGSQLFDIRRLGTLGGGGIGNTRFRFGYDATNYYEMSISSTGTVTAGSVGGFSFGASAGNVSFVSSAGEVNFAAVGAQALRIVTSTSMVLTDGMVVSNAANTTGTTFGASVSDIFNHYGPATRTKAGASANFIGRPIVAIKQDTTQTGNTALSVETDLFSYTVPAATLNTDGESVAFEYAGTFVGNINSKQIRVYFGTDMIFDSGALAIGTNGNWTVMGRIVRTGAATQKCYVNMTTTGAALGAYNNYAAATRTLSGTVVLKITGTAVGASDIVAEASTIDWRGAA